MNRKIKRRKVIGRFTDTYFFLSNFYPAPFVYHDVKYLTVEHAFQAAKTFDYDLQKKIRLVPTAVEAKALGRIAKLRSDWDEVKYQIMYQLVYNKFIYQPISLYLIDTGSKKIVEGNYWHDNYWGSCYCAKCRKIRAKNKLGRILMQVRKELADLYKKEAQQDGKDSSGWQ